jgi:hypothetical protein
MRSRDENMVFHICKKSDKLQIWILLDNITPEISLAIFAAQSF